MHLPQRRRCQRFSLETAKEGVDRSMQFRLDGRNGDIGRKRGYGILQFVQFFDPRWRQQVRAGAQHLPQFDERWTEIGQRQAEALRTTDRIRRRTTHDPTRHREEGRET